MQNFKITIEDLQLYVRLLERLKAKSRKIT